LQLQTETTFRAASISVGFSLPSLPLLTPHRWKRPAR
jgi:hypothetical protein